MEIVTTSSVDRRRQSRRAYYYANRESILAQMASKRPERKHLKRAYDRNRRVSNPARELWLNARARAREKGWPFTISVDEVIVPEFCPVFGLRLCVSEGKRKDESMTLDRIDNALGYISGNVVVVSWRANRMKNDATVEELGKLHQFYAARAVA